MGKTTLTAGGGIGPFQIKTTGTPADTTHAKLASSFRCQQRASTPTPGGRQLAGPTGTRRDLRACLRTASPQPGPAQPVRGLAERLRALTEARAQAQEKLSRWLDSHQRAARPGAAPGTQGAMAIARDALVQDVRTTLASIRTLQADWPDRDEQASADLQAAKTRCMRSALALVLPGLSQNGLVHQHMPELLANLMALDDHLAATGQAGYGVDRLLDALCNRARIRELSGMDGHDQQDEAIDGLNAIAGTLVDALRPGRDGVELNSLLGQDTELDGALKALRVKTTTDFMLRQVVRDRKGAGAQPSEVEIMQAGDDATKLVDREAGIARMRMQLQRALDTMDAKAPTRLLGSMSGVRFDPELVQGLRDTLGEQGSQVGLIIAGLYALERDVVASPQAQRLLQDIQTELTTETDPQPETKADVRYLRQREAGLNPGGYGGTPPPDSKDTLKATQEFLHQEVLRLVQHSHGASPDIKGGPQYGDTRLDDARYLLETTRALTDSMAQAPLRVKDIPPEDRAALLGGLTQAEVQALGLKQGDLPDVPQIVAGLARQGLSSAQEAQQAFATIHAVTHAMTDHKGAQHLVDNDLHFLQGRKDDLKAQKLGDDLLRHLAGDTHISLADARDKDKRGALAAQMQRALAPLGQAIRQQSAEENWRALGNLCAEDRLSLQGPMKRLDEINTRRDKAKATLIAYRDKHRTDIDMDRPKGLDSCRTLRAAINLWRDWKPDTTNSNVVEQLVRMCRNLKGFDPARLHTPGFFGPEFTSGMLEALAKDTEFNEAIDAVIALRETQDESIRMAAEINADLRRMNGALVLRRGFLAPAEHQALAGAIRAAILLQMGTTPIHTFRPADHAQQIIGTLRGWGVPVDGIGPEIDAALDAPFGADELERWREDTPQPADDTQAQALPALLKAIDSLELGTKVKLAMGSRIEVQTGSIPVETTGIVGVNVKGAAGRLTGLEISAAIDGYELTLRKGWDAKGGAELSAKAFQWKGTGVKLEGTAMLEGSGAQVSGVALRFKDRSTMKAALQVLLTQSSISPRDLAMADSIALLDEGKKGIKGDVGAKAGFDPLRTQPHDGSGGHGGVAAGLRGTASIAGTWTQSETAGTGTRVRKTERDITHELAATSGISQRIGLPGTGDSPHNVSSDIAQAGLTKAGVSKAKTKEVTGPDDQIQAGTERLSQTAVSRNGGLKAAEKAGGEPFKRLMAHLDSSHKPADRDLAVEIRKLAGAAREGDLLSVAFTLDSRNARIIDGLRQQATAARRGQTGLRTPQDLRDAAIKDAQAQKILDDPGNYILARISLIPTREKNITKSLLNLMLLKHVTYVEDKGEFVAAEIKPDAAVVQKLHDMWHKERG
jgi:hypothetical protein